MTARGDRRVIRESAPLGSSAPTILIADDDPRLLNVITMYLEIEGFSVLSAGDGERALELIQRYHPDVAVLDLIMPGIDGLEVCRRIRADEKLRSLPVLALTGDFRQRVRAQSAGVDGFITKPLSLNSLRDEVHRVVDPSRHQPNGRL